MHYNLHKISLNRGGSYIDSPKWSKNKKAIINPQNKDGKYFQYAIIAALIYEQIKSHSERISNIKTFIDQYDWKEINFPSNKKTRTIALNILYVPYVTEEIRHVYKSKYNKERENQVILLMITDGIKWPYLDVKKLSALFTGIASKHKGDFYCLNCFQSHRTKNKLKKRHNICKNTDYCYVEMPNEDNKILNTSMEKSV